MSGRWPRLPVPVLAAVRQRLVLWGPVAAYMALLFTLSAMASPPSPVELNDKVKHVIGYGGLGLLAVRATAGGTLSGATGGAAVAAWAIAVGYGVTDELHQRVVPGRTADAADVLADAAGAAAVIVPVWAFGIITRWRHLSGASPRRR